MHLAEETITNLFGTWKRDIIIIEVVYLFVYYIPSFEHNGQKIIIVRLHFLPPSTRRSRVR